MYENIILLLIIIMHSNIHVLQKRNNEIQKPINSTTTNERKNME